ncbi:Phosphoribosyl-ATP pyrophosphohydrolase [candidate division SR1 bacterium Aalborg_AAW-1]|nr:Phosphoribosyl-ATP pyrophosphohydrolase [candidate division SR1 bacterium Aalborg_AAW-1]
MQEPQGLTMVSEFHTLFDAPILDTPQIPTQRAQLRVNLLEEELNELKQAIADGDLVEVADAFADLQYVLSGAILEFGLGDRFADIFAEVQRSNISKACSTPEEAQATVEHYKTTKGFDAHIVAKGDQYLVYRTEDNKVLKSINYSPANIKKFL